MANPAWTLHPQLDRDTASLGDLPLCRVLVINDANYPWVLLVPRRPDIVEVIDLDEVEQAQLMTETTRVSRAVRDVTGATSSTSRRSAMRCRSCTSTSSRAFATIRPGRSRCGASCRPRVYEREALDNFVQPLRKKIWLT